MKLFIYEQDVEIDVKHEGILEVPDGKNVDDLPLSHFEKLAKKKGLSKITKALNNLQVWNKNDDPELSKWAGSMIDKLNKKYGKKESLSGGINEEWNGRKHIEQRLMKYIPKRLQPYVVWLDYEPSSHAYFLTFEKDGIEYSPDPADDVSELAYNARQYTDELLGRKKNPKKPEKKESVKFRKSIKESGMYDYYDVPDGAFDLGSDMPDLDDLWAANKGLPVEDFIQDALDHGFSKIEINKFLKTSGIRNEGLKRESLRLSESTKPFETIEDAARYYFDNWYNGFITNDEIRRNLRRNGYSDDFISDVFEFISELSDDADEYWDDLDESLNEADYAGYYDPFDYQEWTTVHIDRDKKQAFIDGIHKLGLEWKLGHSDRKSDTVELRIFATQDELADLAEIADVLYGRGVYESLKENRYGHIHNVEEAFSTEEYFVGASKEKPMQYDGDNFLYDEIFTFKNDEMGAWEEAIRWNMRGYYVTWEKMIDGEVVESKLYRPRELGNKPYI